MKIFSHDPGQIVCLISREELESYEIKSAEEVCNLFSPKVRDLIQDVAIAARDIPEMQAGRDDKKSFIHTVCAAVEYADRISARDHVFKTASMMSDEHWKLIAACFDEFEMLMEF